MITVGFELHRARGNEPEELDEAALVDVHPDAADAIEGALVIADGDQRVAIVDDLSSAVQQLCFMAAEALLQPGGSYRYVGFVASLDVALEAGDGTVTIRGDDAGEASFARDELLRALYACGRRYLDWIARLGDRPDDVAQLGRFADAAGDTLRQAGLL